MDDLGVPPYIYIYISTHIYIFIYIYIYTYIYTYIHIYVHIHIYIYTYIDTHIYIYTYIYTRTYIYIYVHIYIYICSYCIVFSRWLSIFGHTEIIMYNYTSHNTRFYFYIIHRHKGEFLMEKSAILASGDVDAPKTTHAWARAV